jgi:DNA-binding transcriptional MerR regulator/tetratricopeptide (TPR) repeat protein
MKQKYTPCDLSMKDLVEASGVHRQTIHSYLREGVLPGPCEGAGTRNARYSAQHVELLRLIRELRDERGISLDAIRRSFERVGFDTELARRGLDDLPPSPLLRLGEPEQLTLEAVAERAGAAPALVRTLVDAGVLAADPAGSELDDDAVLVVSAALALVTHGLPEARVVRVAQTAARLAAQEASALVSDATGATEERDPLIARAEERHRRISALVSAVRLSAIHGVVRRLAEVRPRTLAFAHDAIYVPSPLFIRRHDLDRVVADAEAAASAEAAPAVAMLRLGRLVLGLGRYEEAELWLERAARLEPTLTDIWAYLGLGRALSGRIAQGVDACRRAAQVAPGSPRASAFLGAALALHAATTTGLAEATEVLRQALHEARQSRGKPPRDTFEHMEVLLARGRLFTVLPAALKDHDEGEADLREVLSRTTDTRDEDNGFDFPGTNELYRVHALFYLGIAARDAGRTDEGAQLLRECITMDPTSRFAERAYEVLSTLPR